MFFCLTLSLFSSSFLLYVVIIICPTSTYSKNIILVINAFRLVFPFPHHPLPTILPVLFPVNLPFPYFLSHLPYHDISLNGNAFVIGTIILLYVVVEKIKMTDCPIYVFKGFIIHFIFQCNAFYIFINFRLKN